MNAAVTAPEHLGPRERTFAPAGAARARNVLGLALGGLMAMGLGAAAWDMHTEPGGTVAAALVGSLALAVAGMGLVAAHRQRGLSVDLHAGGLVHRHGRRVRVWPWEDVTALYVSAVRARLHGVPMGTVRRYTLQHRDGTRVLLTGALADVDELAARLEAETGRRLLAQACAQVTAGLGVPFGKRLTVTHQGVLHRGQPLAWGALREVDVREGVISLRAEDQRCSWAEVPYAEVPNARVFLDLVNRLREEARVARDG